MALTAGTRISAFYRASGVASNGDARWMVSPTPADSRSPHIGVTAGWHRATVVKDFNPEAVAFCEDDVLGEGEHPLLRSTSHIQVRFDAARWINRTGERYVDAMGGQLRAALDPADVVLRTAALPPCALSLLVVRWATGEASDCVGFQGGWGDTGAVVSDRYIENWMQTLHASLRGRFTVRTAFVASSADVERLGHNAGSLARLLLATETPVAHVGAFYFLWPVESDDGGLPSGYVNQRALLGAMRDLEGAGVETRFPHPSALYRVFLSKEWMATMCLARGFCVPATTRVSVAAIVRDPLLAARNALAALDVLATAQRDGGMACADAARRSSGGSALGGAQGDARGDSRGDSACMRGVAKLGFSWEAADVVRFDGVADLAARLVELVEQPQMCPSAVLVQHLVESPICEIRSFVVEGRIAKMLYTRFLPPGEDGRYADFERSATPADWFDADDGPTSAADGAAALAHAETTITADLVPRWLVWLHSQHHERIPVLRIDTFVVRRRGAPRECDVYIGELTELGASMVGWQEGPSIVKPAVLRSCFAGGVGAELLEASGAGCAAHARAAADDGVARGMLSAAMRSVASGQTAASYGAEF